MLCQDRYFGGVLHDLSTSELPIDVVSFSLNAPEIESLIADMLRPISFHRSFRYRALPALPLAVRDAEGRIGFDTPKNPGIQTLVSERGLLHLPVPDFGGKLSFYSQTWAVDIDISRSTDQYQKRMLFPLTAETSSIVRTRKGRVHLGRGLSAFMDSQSTEPADTALEIPAFASLLRQLVMRPVRHGVATQSKFHELGRHDSSNRLAAFLNIFRNSFELVEEFFDDKFWVDIFEKLCNSEKVAGDAIIFDELVAVCIGVMQQHGMELGPREETFRNEANLRHGLRRTVQELCDYRALLPGFKLKCLHCASTFWYQLKGAAEVVECNGCLQNFAFPIEQPFAYKLNNLVKNNLFESRTKRHGNLTVIRALASLHTRARHSFEHSPQVNLYDRTQGGKPIAELDIAALVDGRLVIGEAKHRSTGFFDDNLKSLRSLVSVAQEIYPDEIVLACYEDERDKLAKAKKSLVGLFNQWKYEPTITTLLVSAPDYFNLTGYRYFYY